MHHKLQELGDFRLKLMGGCCAARGGIHIWRGIVGHITLVTNT
jgi:hypothetical protein